MVIQYTCNKVINIFNEIIECSSIWLGDTTDECEKLLSYFDNILEKDNQNLAALNNKCLSLNGLKINVASFSV